MAQENAAKNPIQAAEITVAVLRGLKEINGGGVTELADHLGMSKSRVHNYLTTLRQEEYVVKEGTTYDIGLRLVGLGTYAHHQQEIHQVAKPELEVLAEETGDLVNLLVEEYGKGIYLHREQGVAFDDEERLPGLRCVAHAVTDNDGKVHGAISVSGPSSRMQGDRYEEDIPQKLEEATNIVSLNMSYS